MLRYVAIFLISLWSSVLGGNLYAFGELEVELK